MKTSWRNVAISLSGIIQAASLVEQLAKTGYLQRTSFETAVESLLQQSPSSVESVYGGIERINTGADKLLNLLNNHRDPNNADILRYTLGMVHLQRKLGRRSEVLYVVGNRLQKVQQQVQHFGYTHDNVVANIADLYTDTISKFQYRIQVTGEYSFLQQQRVANQIRALLLSGIRSAALWRQLGGTRWHLLFYRQRIIDATANLLEEIKHTQVPS